MSNVIQYAEEIVYDWLISLPNDDLDEIHNGNDVLAAINEEAEEEMKNEIWAVIKHQMSYGDILKNLRLYLSNQIRTPQSDEEEEE
jgi:hypothetical protein